ncbi:SDR family NAD(P)-dependent oxidoreductase [Candidatus Nomurabacteria bacterium]|uniref:SDR family NAD(P)-dependent oxidoreductase n=1 Tax=Candidatus Dojkabacteria bacterium TaxID=2099670 RepID=A0A955KWW6_9BACT|nr:SDR family NAD(P)-dependent oxidoreductase [Candidatus Dojkabacteria bacterium]MCB9790191.1 SDR family NAD(P)-dependent oxidoreductase [Candidatus Nomurabacteria bacterium]MCB9803289.1 SDR family NAD(P)-dependent oxidoreductase [Candidatus Nomurabacteria bacterium]
MILAVTYIKTVVITGASEGFGLAIPKKYVAEGWCVISIARHKNPLEDVISIEADLTPPKYCMSEKSRSPHTEAICKIDDIKIVTSEDWKI